MRAEDNEIILTAEELEEYNRRRRGPLTNREQWTPRFWVPSFLTLGLSLLCAGGVVYTTRNLEVQADGNDADTFAFLVGAFIFMGLTIAASVTGTRALRAHLVDTYLSSIADRHEHEDLREQVEALVKDDEWVCDHTGDCAPYTVMDGVDFGVDLNLHISHIGFVKERRAAGEQALRENIRSELSSFLERWASTAPPKKPYIPDYGADDGPHYWATGTYDPDRYYSAVREYGWSGMDYIRDNYGDLDTYESNRPD